MYGDKKIDNFKDNLWRQPCAFVSKNKMTSKRIYGGSTLPQFCHFPNNRRGLVRENSQFLVSINFVNQNFWDN